MKREDILGVRLSQQEREMIEQRAQADGRTASALVRHVVLSHLNAQQHERPHAAKHEGALAGATTP